MAMPASSLLRGQWLGLAFACHRRRLGDGVTLQASQVEVAGNYIGVRLDGRTTAGNRADGIHIAGSSKLNRIGNANPVTDIRYYNVNEVSGEEVTACQGIRGGA